MDFIINFYKELDTINTIIFWGVIIVVILLLIFSIILVNNNRKLKAIITKNGINVDDDDYDDLPIKHEEEKNETKQDNIINNSTQFVVPVVEPKIENNQKNIEINKSIKEEIPFIAEEHIMEYNKNENEIKREEAKLNVPYQRNVLRQMPSTQTSPIGISREDNTVKKEIKQADELQNILKQEVNSNSKNENDKTQIKSNIINNNISPRKYEGNYLKEISQKMENGTFESINRTDYERKQEEEAIISYKELMQKKDSIKMVDEEDAVISIEELMRREKNKEKIYNITEKETDNNFIDELKHFRKDLK